ncbi:MAG: TolC family protein [Pseudotabrizicola sp.]|uniref:TolC family protein n=1 Tax=Pseudotabrizicola sp. TaxID=2939647 RepID=UPI002720BF9E|nr:TolC family protein [Pseudotabrizicola sp.]MDO9640869.1 TolC family protein [Pseudotabrizicola sp.]
MATPWIFPPCFRAAIWPQTASLRLWAGGLSLCLLTACAPATDSAAPGFPFAKSWQGKTSGAPRLMDNALWWHEFRDPTLDALIARSLRGSPDLAAAQARATAALATARSIPGALSVTGGGSALATGGNGAAGNGTLSADAGIDLLFDPGRGRDAARRGAQAGARQALAEAAGARLFLIGRLTETYLSLRHDQRRLALSQTEAGRQRQTLEMARTLAQAGEGTQIETLRSQARLASLDAARPQLEAAVAKGILQLSVLAGDAPGALPPDLTASLRSLGAQPRARLAPDPGIPADLIRNRPDLQVAEARYDAARAALGQARAAFFPQLSLSGTIEAGRTLGAPGTGGRGLVSVGPSLRLPSLPQGPARARADAAEAQVVAAHADWTAAVLGALYEVEAALVDYQTAAKAEAAADRAVGLHAKARSLTREATAAGEATLSDLIAVEDALSNAESAFASARLSRALAFARLNQRLGAGGHPPAPAGQ